MAAGRGENTLFNAIFAAMGLLLLGIAGWIGQSVAHLPAIEQKLVDFSESTNAILADHKAILTDHETRIRTLENAK